MSAPFRILFVCHGNICRSTMAEFVMKDLVARHGLSDRFVIASAATHDDEIGSPVHHGTRAVLEAQGIDCSGKTARRLRRADNIRGFIVNDYDQRNKLSTDFLEYLRTSPDVEDLRALLFQTVIPRNVRITESELAAIPISLYDLRSKGCDAIASLVDEMFEKNIL